MLTDGVDLRGAKCGRGTSERDEKNRARKFQKVLTFVPWKASEFATMNTAPLPAELSTLRELVVSLRAALEESRREKHAAAAED